MDAGTARRHGFEVGDQVDVLLEGPKQSFEIVGIFNFGDRFDALAVTFAAFDLETAQQVFGAPGLVDGVNVTTAPGVTNREVQTRLVQALGPGFEVDLASEFAADRSSQFSDFFALLTQLLLGFAAIGLVVGAFIIFNTFAILVAQRTREFGLLRAMGASGRQVIVAVILEAALVGFVAALIGLAVGIGLAALLLGIVSSLGFDVPDGPLEIVDRTVIVALCVGVFVTIASSVIPAIRAVTHPAHGRDQRREPGAAAPLPAPADPGHALRAGEHPVPDRRRRALPGRGRRHERDLARRARRAPPLLRRRGAARDVRPAARRRARPATARHRRHRDARPRQRDAQPTADGRRPRPRSSWGSHWSGSSRSSASRRRRRSRRRSTAASAPTSC